ncbi:hypothetical protein WCN91_06520 [Pseudoalteromonas sp. YIC-827]|uniref:MSHA biogenesis protein MshK n=1 Tax=Pseudoalteromonas qingdaonensis TaxID=3131913 RepID=A0ABU9MW71_9GAMM
MKPLLFSSLALLLSTSATAQQLNDPTRPAAGVSTTASTHADASAKQWVLESVVNRNGQFKAIISGSLYARGARLGQYHIARIDANSVLLTQGQKQLKLELYGNDIKN